MTRARDLADGTFANDLTVDTNTLYVDSTNNRVGIGNAAPGNLLEISGSSPILEINSTAGVPELQFSDGGVDEFSIQYDTGGNALRFVEGGVGAHMVIKDGGNVGIGTSSPSEQINLVGASGTSKIRFDGDSGNLQNNFIGITGYDDLIIASDEANTGTASTIQFRVDGSERLRLDASGNLLVGTTDTALYNNSTTGTGFHVAPSGWIETAATGTNAIFNKLSSDGTIAEFRKDGSTVGSIGVASGDRLYIAAPDSSPTGLVIDGDNARINPSNGTGADRDAAVNLGHSGARFANLYLSGGAYLGGTGSANHLDDYEEGTWTPTPISLTTSGTVTYTGTYTKIGRFVFGLLTVSSSGGTTTATADTTRFSGLPFTSDSIGGMGLSVITGTTTGTAAGQVAFSGTTLITGGWSAAANIRMSFWYTAT
jgi:hypothetical protein